MGYTTADLQTFDLILFAGGTFAAALVTGIALPLLLAGTWFGLWLYARLDEAGFSKAVLGLLLISGPGLVVRWS